MMRGRSVRGRRRDEARAAIGHALAYTTWKSLASEQGLDDAQAADLMCGLARSSACPRASRAEPGSAVSKTHR
jgi:hypothetical protein